MNEQRKNDNIGVHLRTTSGEEWTGDGQRWMAFFFKIYLFDLFLAMWGLCGSCGLSLVVRTGATL